MLAVVPLFLLTVALNGAIHGVKGYGNDPRLGTKKLTGTELRNVLNRHNEYRNLVASGKERGQKPAENMKLMVWDDIMADQAYYWAAADHVPSKHDPKLENYPAGQNLYSMSWYDIRVLETNLTEAVDLWYNEVRKYGYQGYFTFQSGHYSQVIWANSNKVGCAVGKWLKNKEYTVYLVCNYHEPGNVQGQLPYVYGQVNCQKYNMKVSSQYPNLCVAK